MRLQGTYNIFTILILSCIAYKYTQQKLNLIKNIFFIYSIGSFIKIILFFFNISINIYSISISLLFIKFIYNTRKAYKIKSDKLNKENVFYIVYKPKNLYMSLKGLFGFPVASSGIIIYENNKYYVFQFRLDSEYYQKIELEIEKINNFLEKYIVIDTKFKINNLKEEWQSQILSKKRIQLKGLWRFNCLRTASIVLNQIPNFKVKRFEFLTSIYFKRIINDNRKGI